MTALARRTGPWVARFFRTMTALCLFALMVLTCADVTGRYFLSRPVHGGLELTEILMAGTIFFALPLVSRGGENVMIDLVVLPGALARRIQHGVVNLIGAGVAGVLAWQLCRRARQLGRAGETTLQIEIPMDLVAYGISVLMGVTALAFALNALDAPEDAPAPAREEGAR